MHLPDKKVSLHILINHDIRYIHKDETLSTFSQKGSEIPFVSKEFKRTTESDLVFVRKVYYVNVDDLPPVVGGRIYIVSKMMANLLGGIRNDFAYPGTHPVWDRASIVDSRIDAVKRFRLPDQVIIDDEHK